MLVSSFMVAVASLGIGLLLSAIHFGGLWLTVRLLPSCTRPRLFFWSSYLVRYALTLWGFAQVMSYGGPALLFSLVGFYLMRAYMLSNVSGMGMSEFLVFKRPTWK